jgi:6-phosphogluconolactonase
MRLSGFAPAALIFCSLIPLASPYAADYLVYIGTYTRNTSKGIYAFRFTTATGELAPLGLMAETPSPSFIAAHPNGRFLYASNEREWNEQMGTKVSAFAIDHATGHLMLLNRVDSHGDGPAHIVVDPTGKSAIVANMRGGSVAAFPILPDGRLGEASSVDVHHGGPGGDPQRQPGPHAHGTALSPDNRFAVVSEHGIDELMLYHFNAAKAVLTPNNPPFFKEGPGNAPWHLAFHPNGKALYVVNELTAILNVFTFDPASGSLAQIQSVSTVSPEFTGKSNPAEPRLDRLGRFLYVSNRDVSNSGKDNIAVYSTDAVTGKLSPLEFVPSGGKTPRNIALDPSGAFLLAGNQGSNNLMEFHVDATTGRLTPHGAAWDVPEPTCIVFVPLKTKR